MKLTGAGRGVTPSKKLKVEVKLHHPCVSIEEFFGIRKVYTVGQIDQILALEGDNYTMHFLLENVLRYEVVEVDE